MNMTTMEFLMALILVVVAFTLVTMFLKFKANSSERRMRQMIDRCGLDPEIVARGDKEMIMREIRSRCSKCQAEDVCERWLAGEFQGENTFCPNAEVFRVLAQ